MKIKTVNSLNIHEKPKVLFVSHPADFNLYFDILSDDILSAKDCAVYCYDDIKSVSSREWQSDVSEMNLVVFPITDRFLSKDNCAMNIYWYGRDLNIPILPIMVERNLDRKFNSVCGERQFLDRMNDDPTIIPYSKKLEDYLSLVLIGNELSDRVRKAFYSRIFLSYRKKDRKYAQDLMRAIHRNEFARGVAIWYDEFLQPDEQFNDVIRNAIANCDLFVLAVTPNLICEENYVHTCEYVAALEDKKQMLPIELVETNKDRLRDWYPGIPDCISIDNHDALEEALKAFLLQDYEEQSTANNPERLYHIGLAYLFGIEVEIDRDYGVKAISAAAEQGSIDAAKDIVRMYYNGFYVRTDFSQSVYWQKNLIELLRMRCAEDNSANNRIQLANELRFLTEIERKSTSDNQDSTEMISACREAIDLCNSIGLPDNEETLSMMTDCKLHTLRSLAILYEMAEEYELAIALYNEALELRATLSKYDKELENDRLDVENLWRTAQIHHDLGILYSAIGNYESSVSELLKSIELYESIAKKTPEFLPNEASVHSLLAEVAVKTDVSLAEKHSVRAVEICKELVAKNGDHHALIYASALLQRACILTDLGSTDFDALEKTLLEAKDIFERYDDSASYQTAHDYIVTLYKLAGLYRKNNMLDDAGPYYEKATTLASELLEHTFCNQGSRLTFGHLFFDYGTYLATRAYFGMDPKEKGFSNAVDYLRKALYHFENTGFEGEKFVEEAKHVISTFEEELSKGDSSTGKSIPDDKKEATAAATRYIILLRKGSSEEFNENYEKARLLYESAYEQIKILQQSNFELGNDVEIDMLDRLAFVCEMLEDIDAAQMYYNSLANKAYEIAVFAQTEEALMQAVRCMSKSISFLEKHGFFIRAALFQHMLEVLLEYSI